MPQSRCTGRTKPRVVVSEGAETISYTLAIDQGTHASRAILFDDGGRIIAEATEEIDLLVGDETIEQDAEQIIRSVKQVVEEILQGTPGQIREKISCCGLACQRSTVVPWRSDGSPLTNAISWQDVRGASQVTALRQREAEIRQISGLPLSAHYGASKLRWLLENSDAVRSCPADELRLSPLVSFLLFHLLEEKHYTVDDANAQRTQLFDVEKLDWSAELTSAFDVPASPLPRCSPVSTLHGHLEGNRIPITAVSGDQNAAFFGNGDLGLDGALINIGSGAFILRPLSSRLTSEKQLTGIAASDEKTVTYLREATVNGAGNALNWAMEEWQVPVLYDLLPFWLDQVDDPPVFINAVGGLAAPWWREDLQSHFIDGGEAAEIAERVVAVVESIAFTLMANLDLMAKESPLRQLRISGGLSQLDGLCQKISDLSGLPVTRSDAAEATARGIAWLAAGKPQQWQGDQGDSHSFQPQQNRQLQSRFERFKNALEEIPEEER